MTNTHLSAQEIAHFLIENPNFLIDHADIFCDITVPNPDGQGTLSLLERQVSTLRERLHKTQTLLNELGFIAHENKGINDSVNDWCIHMLAQKDASLIPYTIKNGLHTCFPDLSVSLRLWNLDIIEEVFIESNSETKNYIASLDKPYCGSVIHEGLIPYVENAQSIAIVPLHVDQSAVGAILFASPIPNHFHEDIGLVFLENIGKLASASLSRLSLGHDNYPELEPA